MTPETTEEFSKIERWVTHWLTTQASSSSQKWELIPLAGDGSTRRFFRFLSPAGNRILLSDPGWRFTKDYSAHQMYLGQLGLPVPRFYLEDPVSGYLVMEDLGDELLQKRILDEPAKKMAWLKRAVELAAQIHGKTSPVPSQIPAASRRFDKAKYRDELQFTLTHLHEGLLKLPPLDAQGQTKLNDYCAYIAGIEPQGFCHRDYHTRNLMVKGDDLYLIDFQDARMGSPLYDLASLVFDAYMPLSEAEQNELIATYKTAIERFPIGKAFGARSFKEDLQLVAFQRLVKAAGSFASFYTRNGKKTHFEYLLPALHQAQTFRAQMKSPFSDNVSFFPLDQWIEKIQQMKAKKWQIEK